MTTDTCGAGAGVLQYMDCIYPTVVRADAWMGPARQQRYYTIHTIRRGGDGLRAAGCFPVDTSRREGGRPTRALALQSRRFPTRFSLRVDRASRPPRRWAGFPQSAAVGYMACRSSRVRPATSSVC